MAINYNTRSKTCSSDPCTDKFGCPTDRCPDFIIGRHDTKPAFKVAVGDCDGPMDLQGLVVEANMWAVAKLKTALNDSDDYFRLADDIGFEQVMVGDVIIMDRVRMPEYMLVKAFDETNKLIQVERGYRSTTPSAWKKGTKMRIFRILNAPAESEMAFVDRQEVDGTTTEDVLIESLLVHEWDAEDVCLPGCYWFEFKVMKMQGLVLFLPGNEWSGDTHLYTDGFYYTGTTQTNSSVRLSYDAVNAKYLLDDTPWTGDSHLHSGTYFTGDVHNNGSVPLTRLGIPSDIESVDSDTVGILSSSLSVIPSFTDDSLTPYYFGCVLDEGVEWVRRFPIDGSEGFLIKITNTPTGGIIA